MADNKSIVRAYLEEAWSKKNPGAVDIYFSPDFVQRAGGVGPGREGVRASLETVNGAFSDLHYHVEDIFGEGDKVCWRWMLHGHHTGAFMGFAATGRAVTVTGIDIVRVADGKIIEHWGERDSAGLMQQLRG